MQFLAVACYYACLPCCAQVNGVKKHTAIHSKTVNCVFDETLIFNLNGQTLGQVRMWKLSFTIHAIALAPACKWTCGHSDLLLVLMARDTQRSPLSCPPAHQLEKQVIEVSIFDANSVTRNSLIGLYEFDLLNVYYNPNHEVRACRCACAARALLFVASPTLAGAQSNSRCKGRGEDESAGALGNKATVFGASS